MSSKAGEDLPIKGSDLIAFLQRATDMLRTISYDPKKTVAQALEDGQTKKTTGLMTTSVMASRTPKMISILEIAGKVNGGDVLLDDSIGGTLNIVRMGVQVGMYVAAQYARFSGFDALKERNVRSALGSDAEKAEWSAKQQTHAAITVFVASYYVVWRLNQFKTDELGSVNPAFAGLPEPVLVAGQVSALNALLFHYASYLATTQNGLEFAKVSLLYFKAVFDYLKGSKDALKYVEAFTQNNYRLEGTTFSVNGFEGDVFGSAASAEFKRVDINTIVGNREAKNFARRLAQRLLAYDFDKKMNPMVELGAFQWLLLLMGKPGTGKTLALGAALTLTYDYCKALKIPFRAHPMPNTMVSTFQGGTAENMQNWMRALADPNTITVAVADDAENMFESRTRQGVSEGVRSVIGTFLVNTEGTGVIVRGNASMLFATNIPDQMDQAVLNRIQGRAPVDGASTREDFADQLKLWTNGVDAWEPGMVNLMWPKDYTFLGNQGFSLVEPKVEEMISFRDSRLAELHDRLVKNYPTDSFDYYGHFFAELVKMFPLFSSRDVRNIQTSVMSGMFDFDFPGEWFENRETFVGQDYATKRAMILECAKGTMGNRSFAEVLFQKTVRYLDTTIAILEGGISRQVNERVEQLQIEEAARARLQKDRS